jgi:hypothetical protein
MVTLGEIWASSNQITKNLKHSQALVAHACNPSYSGSRDQEDQGSRPALANSLRPYLKKYPTKGVME